MLTDMDFSVKQEPVEESSSQLTTSPSMHLTASDKTRSNSGGPVQSDSRNVPHNEPPSSRIPLSSRSPSNLDFSTPTTSPPGVRTEQNFMKQLEQLVASVDTNPPAASSNLRRKMTSCLTNHRRSFDRETTVTEVSLSSKVKDVTQSGSYMHERERQFAYQTGMFPYASLTSSSSSRMNGLSFGRLVAEEQPLDLSVSNGYGTPERFPSKRMFSSSHQHSGGSNSGGKHKLSKVSAVNNRPAATTVGVTLHTSTPYVRPVNSESVGSSIASLEAKFGARSTILDDISNARSLSLGDRYRLACGGSFYESTLYNNNNDNNDIPSEFQRSIEASSSFSGFAPSSSLSCKVYDNERLSADNWNEDNVVEQWKLKCNSDVRCSSQRELNHSNETLPRYHGYSSSLSFGDVSNNSSLKCVECLALFHTLQDLTVHMMQTKHYLNLIGATELHSPTGTAGSRSGSIESTQSSMSSSGGEEWAAESSGVWDEDIGRNDVTCGSIRKQRDK